MVQRKVTLRDVAEAAGVSINTVSRALNNKPDVSKQTRKQVLAAAKKLNYIPNQLAQGLRGKHSRSLGVIAADISNPFFADIIHGIEQVAFKRGFAIIVGNSDEDAAKEAHIVQTMVEQRVAGILLTPTQRDDKAVQNLIKQRVPFVLMARRFEMLPSNAVLNDDYAGAYQAVNYLTGKGYRRILFLNGPTHMWSATQRLQGYRKALEDSGVRIQKDLVHSCEPTMYGAFEAMKQILLQGIEMDAVFAFSDYMAVGAIKALQNAGKRIPRDVAVMGYDGIDIGEMLEPALSTVSIARKRLGIEAAEILLDMLDNNSHHAPKQITLPPEIVIRDSA